MDERRLERLSGWFTFVVAHPRILAPEGGICRNPLCYLWEIAEHIHFSPWFGMFNIL